MLAASSNKPSVLTPIKTRLRVIEDWQQQSNEYKIITNWFRYSLQQQQLSSTSKISLILFAYCYEYRSQFSKIHKGSKINILDDGLTVLNVSSVDPLDFNFRGQLIRMKDPLIRYQNNIAWEVQFQKLRPYETVNVNENIYLKGKITSKNISSETDPKTKTENKNTTFIRLKNAKYIAMDKNNNLIIEVSNHRLLKKTDIVQKSTEVEADDDDISFSSESNAEEIGMEDEEDDGYAAGDPFVSAEYYFVGIISNKVTQFDTDSNNYHLDGYGIDSAQDYIYDGEGNNVIDTEELTENAWVKPCIMNMDVVRVECNMDEKTLTFYKNGIRMGPKNVPYTMSFDHYGNDNKQFYPAVCVVNRNVKCTFKYIQ